MYKTLREKMERIIKARSYMSDDEIMDFSDLFVHQYQDEQDFKLYRYMRADYDSIRNLEKEVIYLSDNGTMNDIYEGIPEISSEDFTYKDIRALDDIMLMKCFSETNTDTLMWGHYADGAKGFCVEYNFSYIDINNEILQHIFPVVYSKDRFTGVDLKEMIAEKRYLNDEIYENAEPSDYPWLKDIYYLFLSKDEKWKYEKEWRILYNKYELYKNNYNWQEKRVVKFPYTSGVYLGARMEKKYKEHVAEIVHKLNSTIDIPRNNIKLYEMNLSKKKFEFNFKELK